MTHLVACIACHRHVLASEDACPFCGHAQPPELWRAPGPPMPDKRLGRAAMFAFGAALAAAGCGDSHTGDDAGGDAALADGGFDSGMVVAAYGSPSDAGVLPADAGPEDAAADAGDVSDAGPPDAMFFPPYGAPPADASDTLA